MTHKCVQLFQDVRPYHCAPQNPEAVYAGLEGARASGKCSDVFLHVRDRDTPALELYQKLGFTVHRRESIHGGVFGMLNGSKAQTLMKLQLGNNS